MMFSRFASFNINTVRRSCGVIHAIDPFKVDVGSALEKLSALRDIGSPFAIVASTDFDANFDLDAYLQSLSGAGLPLLTHFLPNPRGRVPIFQSSGGALLTLLANSRVAAYSNPETIFFPKRAWDAFGYVLIRSVGLTLGDDERSRNLAGAICVSPTESGIGSYLSPEAIVSADAFYLFSRNEPIEPSLVEYVRLRLPPSCIFFVSGCVTKAEQARTLLRAGAQYVVVGSALERIDWQIAFELIFLHPAPDNCVLHQLEVT